MAPFKYFVNYRAYKETSQTPILIDPQARPGIPQLTKEMRWAPLGNVKFPQIFTAVIAE